MNTPVLCTAIVVQRPGPAGRSEVLLLKRAARGDDPWSGHWQNAGGRVDWGESPARCAVRELLEETGLVASENDLVLLGVSSHVAGWKHQVGIVYRTARWEGEPENREPDRHSELGWFDLADPPRPMMPGANEVLSWIVAGNRGAAQAASASGPLAGLAEPAGLAGGAPVLPTFVDPVGDF
jgi:8-oxo-dGTP diphosphatase